MDTSAGVEADSSRLLDPALVYSRAEVLERPGPVPASPGVYGWYFDEVPPGVPTAGCHITDFGYLLYVGISPKAPPRNGRAPSRQNLRKRVKYHFRGNAAGSTFRLTLGCLLTEELGIELRRVGSGERLIFSSGEEVLSDWMGRHARVCWVVNDAPWLLESDLIGSLTLPLNLDQNRHSGFRATLSEVRAKQRARARLHPVVPR